MIPLTEKAGYIKEGQLFPLTSVVICVKAWRYGWSHFHWHEMSFRMKTSTYCWHIMTHFARYWALAAKFRFPMNLRPHMRSERHIKQLLLLLVMYPCFLSFIHEKWRTLYYFFVYFSSKITWQIKFRVRICTVMYIYKYFYENRCVKYVKNTIKHMNHRFKRTSVFIWWQYTYNRTGFHDSLPVSSSLSFFFSFSCFLPYFFLSLFQ
jgi:hypothetical protein